MKATIVMATHGAWELTEHALEELDKHTVDYEVVAVDNASPDETARMLAATDGVELIVNDANLGFGVASNVGAERATGELLVFLNSDSFVTPGWLEPIAAAFEREAVAAVVPRLLNPDGTLQEAGALLGADGTSWQYGAGDDPERPRYLFRRVVDFGAGACLTVRRSEFLAAGGFDALYSPAYYEDADLCLRLAEHGGLVAYEPRSTVVHVGQGSTPRATTEELSERNRRRFVERWGEELRSRPASLRRPTARQTLEARDARAPLRHLVVSGRDAARACSHAAELAAACGGDRVALLPAETLGDGAAADLLAAGVELADGPTAELWLRVRRFYFDTVWLEDGDLAALVRETQPQAVGASREPLDPRYGARP
jgi:GT2 family glycosyltransferase